uniref:Uncharacterized protein n=1 Tax=Amphimedon queenslandica TaxID=400682 RepID=A0A1X7TSP5_AMPQE
MERIDQRRSLDDKKTTLLTAMQETVSSDYRKLKDIATVLSDVEQTRDIGNEIMTIYEETIPQEDVSTVVQPQEVVGGNEDCASDILRNNHSALSQSITEPVSVARLLHEEVIPNETLSCVMSTRGSVSDSRTVLLKAVRDAVHSNYKHLELFVTVLRKFSETAHIGDTIFEEYKHNFSTDINVDEIETYLTESKKYRGSSCVSSDSETEDSAILGHTIPFTREMRKEFKEMRTKFGSTFFEVRRLFSKKWAKSQKDINKVKTLLADCFKDLKSELSVAKTIDGVLDVVERKCSIVDVHPLEVIAVQFKVKEAEDVIKKHKEAAEEFCKSVSVSLSKDETFQAIPTRYLLSETITFELNWDADETTLQDINDVLLELELLHKYQIKVVGVGPGSVVVTCYCPAEYTGSLIMTVLGKIEILQKKGLKKFKVGNCTIWNKVLPIMTAETPKKIDQPTKQTVTDYEGNEQELASFGELSKKQIQEIVEMKLKLADNQQDIEIAFLREQLAARDRQVEEFQTLQGSQSSELVSLKEQLAAGERQIKELLTIQGSQSSVSNDEMVTLQKMSKMKDHEIEDLKAALKKALKQNTASHQVMTGQIKWHSNEVQLTSPSEQQCSEVLAKLQDKHQQIYLRESSSSIAELLIPPLLQRKTKFQITIP